MPKPEPLHIVVDRLCRIRRFPVTVDKVAPSLIDRIPYWGFLQDDVILTKNGQILFLYEVRTAGVDGRSAVDLDRVNQAWQKLLGTIEGPDRAFVFFMRPDQPLPTHFDEANDIPRERVDLYHFQPVRSLLGAAHRPRLGAAESGSRRLDASGFASRPFGGG